MVLGIEGHYGSKCQTQTKRQLFHWKIFTSISSRSEKFFKISRKVHVLVSFQYKKAVLSSQPITLFKGGLHHGCFCRRCLKIFGGARAIVRSSSGRLHYKEFTMQISSVYRYVAIFQTFSTRNKDAFQRGGNVACSNILRLIVFQHYIFLVSSIIFIIQQFCTGFHNNQKSVISLLDIVAGMNNKQYFTQNFEKGYIFRSESRVINERLNTAFCYMISFLAIILLDER